MYTANDIRKIQVSLGLVEESEVGADLSKRYTAEDIAAIQKRNAQIGQEQLRLEGRPPSMIQTTPSVYSRALDGYRDAPPAEPRFSLDALNDQASAGEKYVVYNDWLESGTEAESKRRRNLIGSFGTLEKVIAQEVVGGKLELTGTMEEMVNQRLIKKGYTPEEIAEARRMAEYYDGMTLYDVGRRISQTAKGTAVTVGSFIPQLLDYSVQRAKNLAQREKTRAEMLESQGPEWMAPEEALARNAKREETLREADLPVSQDTLGYKMYQSGQAALEDAMRGETGTQRFVHGAATSAAENLALAAINPALVLPAMTMQGAADSLAEATASGKDIGRAVTSAGLKAGVGWIIEEAGVAQMAQNMGKQFAASALSQNILNFINSAPGMGALKESAPVLYGVVASGADEAVEEFVQSYANKLVDVAMGDADASELVSLEQLAEAGMGAAGGALGGAMIGGVSSIIGTASKSWAQPRPEEVADQQLQAAVERAGQVGQAMQEAQQTEIPAEPQTEADMKEAQPPATQAEPSLVDAYLAANGDRLEGDVWELLRQKRPETQVQAQTQETRPLPVPVKAAEETGTAEPIQRAWNDAQQEQALLLGSETSMTEAAVTVAVDAMPDDVSREAYLVSANSLYQMARQGIAKTAEEAIQLAERGGARIGDVLATPGGESALRQIYNQGRLESLEAQSQNPAGLAPAGQAGTVEYEPGALVPEEDRVLIDLFAAASDTAVTVREKLENDAGGYIDTALGKVVFGAEAGADTFGTILHESSHWYDSWDREGGRELQNELIRYLAEQRGFENVGAMIEGYIQEYQNAGQELSYAQACEELTADALRGVFDSKESISRWIEKQQQLAAQSQEQRGAVDRMMGAVRELLNKIIEKAKSILSADPGNAAARQAQQLAEDQKRALEEMYYKHAETAMKAEREARAQGSERTAPVTAAAERANTAEFIQQPAAQQEAPQQRTLNESRKETEWDSLKRDLDDLQQKNVQDARASAARGDVEWAALERDLEALYQSNAAEIQAAEGWRYQMPVTEIRSESGQRAAAWDNVDRAAIEQDLEDAYRQQAEYRVPVERLRALAQQFLRTEQSKANQITIAKKLESLAAYLSSGKMNGDGALAAAEDIAESIMLKSGRLDRDLWEQYPDLHYHTLYVQRNGTEYKELAYKYGDYATAQKELAKFGIKLTTGEAHADSAIDKVYQSLSSDYGELFPADITDAMGQVDRIAQIREMIKPKIQNQYGENWEEAKADLAMRILGGLVSEGVTDQTAAGLLNQRINENLNRHRQGIRERVVRTIGNLERSAQLAARQDAQRIVNQAAEGNRRRAEEWAKMNRNQRIALAQSKDALQRARNARSADATRRAIAANLNKLNRMVLHPSEKAHIPVAMVQDVLKIAEIANSITRNKNALMDIRALADRINEQAKADNGVDGLADDWKNSGIDEMLHGLVGSLEARARRNAKLEQRADAAARRIEQGLDVLYSTQQQQAELSEAAQAEGEEIALRLDKLTPEQLNLLRDITSAVLTVVQNQNKLLATQTAQKASEFAAVAKREVENSRKALGQNPTLLQKLSLKYHESVLNAERFFAVLGGYKHGGAMETLAKSLAAGEAKQAEVKEKGMRIFSNVTEGEQNREMLRKFAGPDAELVDVGFLSGTKINHAQAIALWFHLQNAQNTEHVLSGVRVPNMRLYAEGKMEEAFRLSELQRFKIDSKQDYAIQIQGIRNKIESVLTDYDRKWIEDVRELFESYTKNETNRTSRMLSGYDKATVKNYFPLVVDPDTLQKREIDGLVFNGTIEGRGFLKERKQHAAQPILLEEVNQAAMRILSDTAAYSGLAPAIRDFNKIWNANRGESGSLRAAVRQNFGDGGVQYVEDYISDLQRQPRGRKSIFDGLNGIRGRYAGAVLNLNPKVVLGQISGVFGAGSELGGQATAEAFGYMAKRLAGQYDKAEDARIRQEMMDHGYWGLEAVLTDGPTAEIAELRKRKDRISQITEKLPGAKAMEYMDKLTREGIWVGAKSYVQDHLGDYGLTDADLDSDAYWAAVATKATETINRTQPNYTVSQLAAIQRNPNQLAKIMTMFKTQGFQNYGIVQYAIEDYRAQKQRVEELTQKIKQGGLDAEELSQAEADLELAKTQDVEAGQRLVWAVGSQAVQAVVYSAIAVLAGDLLLHDLDEEKDDDGKITPLSVIRRLGELTIDSAAGSVFLLQEAWSIVGNLFGIRDDDPISLTGIDAFSDLAGDLLQVNKAFTSGEMDAFTMLDKVTDLAGSAGNLAGLPLARVKRLAEGVAGWAKDIYTAAQTDGVSLGDVITAPTSSSQYDDLYTAAFENENPADAQEAIEALQKLDKLNPPKKPSDAKAGDTKIISELLKREKEFGNLIQDAAAARVAGNSTQQQKLMRQLVNTLADALGIDPKTKDGQRRLTTVINKVNTAISDEVRAQMGADSSTGATIYTPVLNALEAGSGLKDALTVLRRAGIQDEDIRRAVQTAYKEDYLYSDDAGRAAIENKLLSLKDANGEPYFTEDQLAGWITDWELKGFNESVYTDLDEALRSRNRLTAQEEIFRYMNAGKSADSIHDRIVALYRDVYLAAGQAQRQELARFLVGLRGPKGEKLVSTDTLVGWIKDEAKNK